MFLFIVRAISTAILLDGKRMILSQLIAFAGIIEAQKATPNPTQITELDRHRRSRYDLSVREISCQRTLACDSCACGAPPQPAIDVGLTPPASPKSST